MLTNYDQYQGFIFDMDGTLLDTMPAHLIAWQKTSEKYGFPFSRDWLHSLGGMPSIKILAEVNMRYQLNIDVEQASKFKMAVFKQVSDQVKRIEKTTEILEKFSCSKRIAIGTGSQRISAERLLTLAGLYEKIDALVTANDVDRHKPNPDTFLLAAEQLDLQPSQCLVFEDTLIGRQAAHAAQMDCVLLQDERLTLYPWRDRK